MKNPKSVSEKVRGIKAPFAWYGGKKNMAPWLIERFPEHVHYVEPFGGAGNVLLAKPPSTFEVFNDLDHRVVNFFRVLQDPESFELLRLRLELSPYARQEFSDVLNAAPSDDPIENARRFFVMMRQARGGLGMSKITDRAWAVSPRTRRKMPEAVSKYLSAIDGLPEIHERLRPVVIECLPAIEVIQTYDGTDTFSYLDPTYLAETRHGQKAKTYAHEMTEADHVALLDVILKFTGKVMISGYPAALYDEMLRGWRRDVRPTKSHVANSGQQRVEVVWMNY